MVAKAWEVEHERIRILRIDLARNALEVDILYRFNIYATKIVFPGSAPFDLVHDFARYVADWLGGRCRFHERRLLQLLVIEGIGFVVFIDGRQQSIAEDASQEPRARPALQLQLSVLDLPAALPSVLIFPLLRVAGARLRLDIVEPDIFHARSIRPYILAGDRTGMAPDALIEVQDHRNLSAYLHNSVFLLVPRASSLSRRHVWSECRLLSRLLHRATQQNRAYGAR